jgi:cobalt/nickel transport system ATP-binding protein
MLARTDLLQEAGLRLPWGIATAQLLRAQGLLDDRAPGPRTAGELAATFVSATAVERERTDG